MFRCLDMIQFWTWLRKSNCQVYFLVAGLSTQNYNLTYYVKLSARSGQCSKAKKTFFPLPSHSDFALIKCNDIKIRYQLSKVLMLGQCILITLSQKWHNLPTCRILFRSLESNGVWHQQAVLQGVNKLNSMSTSSICLIQNKFSYIRNSRTGE